MKLLGQVIIRDLPEKGNASMTIARFGKSCWATLDELIHANVGHSDRPSFITDQRRFDHHGGTAERPADGNRFCVPVRPVDGGPRLYAVPPIPSTLRPDGVGGELVTTVRDIRLLAYHAGQCDPKKCTSLRLRRFGLLTLVPRPTAIPTGALLLTPK